MSQTVIGIFEKKDEAQNAVQDLLRTGLPQEKIDIAAESHTGSAGTTTSTYERREDRSDDSISNFFRNLFGSDDEARDYSEVGRRGWIVTVHAQSRQEAELSAQTLDKNGAVDVNERASQYRSGASHSSKEGYSSASPGKSDTSIPIIEESAEIGKRVVETGGARIRSRIIERPVEEKMRLRQEHLSVERNPVNRPATEADLANFKEGDVNVTERAEVPVVNKEARVVEEVRLHKDVEERNETVRDTVRKTEVDVDKLRPEDRDRYTDDRDRDPSTRT
jgi:stress response protein YsnF